MRSLRLSLKKCHFANEIATSSFPRYLVAANEHKHLIAALSSPAIWVTMRTLARHNACFSEVTFNSWVARAAPLCALEKLRCWCETIGGEVEPLEGAVRVCRLVVHRTPRPKRIKALELDAGLSAPRDCNAWGTISSKDPAGASSSARGLHRPAPTMRTSWQSFATLRLPPLPPCSP